MKNSKLHMNYLLSLLLKGLIISSPKLGLLWQIHLFLKISCYSTFNLFGVVIWTSVLISHLKHSKISYEYCTHDKTRIVNFQNILLDIYLNIKNSFKSDYLVAKIGLFTNLKKGLLVTISEKVTFSDLWRKKRDF